MSERFQRLCDVCGGYDTDPRHVAGLGESVEAPSTAFLLSLPEGVSALAIAELVDPSTTVRHLGCCAAAGCASCAEDLATVGPDLTGDALLAALQAREA